MQNDRKDVGNVKICKALHALHWKLLPFFWQFLEGLEVQPFSLCHSDSLGVWPVIDFAADRMTIKSITNPQPWGKKPGHPRKTEGWSSVKLFAKSTSYFSLCFIALLLQIRLLAASISTRCSTTNWVQMKHTRFHMDSYGVMRSSHSFPKLGELPTWRLSTPRGTAQGGSRNRGASCEPQACSAP